LKYRREIDGLRAVAVVPVVLFHAKWPGFSGGFIGVDVFFVISGYLISSIILAELAAGKFLFRSFYERRIRRILPALYLMVLATFPFAWFYYLPADLKDYAESLASIPLFLSNFVFEAQSGYFERTTDIKPLIHTWTLAVEEQFYLLFPALLVFLYRFKLRTVFTVILMIACLSLALAEWGTIHYPTDSFFLLPTRVWELFTGVIVALYFHVYGRGLQNGALSLLGLLMICVAVFSYDTQTPFPGLYALLPTIGAALVILCTRTESRVGRFLGNRAFVAIGLISFSLYLWHQPVLAIATYQMGGHLGFWLSVLLILASTGLSVLSWRFIEQPCRDKTRVSSKSLFGVLIGVSLVFLALGFYAVEQKGDLYRFGQNTLRIANPDTGGYASLKRKEDGAIFVGDPDKTPSAVFMGDSHTAVLMQSLNATLKDFGKSALVYLTAPCPPFVGVLPESNRGPACKAVVDRAFQKAAGDTKIKTVVLHAEWSNYTTGTRWGRRSLRYLSDEQSTEVSLDENRRVFEAGLERSLAALGPDKGTLIVTSVPEYEVLVPNYLAKRFHRTGQLDKNIYLVTKEKYDSRNAAVQLAFDGLQDAPGVSFLDAFAIFCPDDKCRMVDDDMNVLYFDANHLSRAGSDTLVREIIPFLE
jgi:peptidoglycan/LPS O-acetylase OafA/YrhL